MPHQIKKNLGVTFHHKATEFRVWAPFAKSVSLAVPYISYDTSNALPMEPEGDGYWSLARKDVEPGQTYKFLIDTGTEVLRRNDPRGRALTTSNNGDSIVVAPTFEWRDTGFVGRPINEHILYELHVGTFNRRDPASQGTFFDAIEKLDYLADLGITAIELMPITSMLNSTGWGYNTISIFAVESSYGGRRGLMEFVDACHARGISVILDLVYNHFFGGTDLWQFDGWSENGRGGIYFYNDPRGDTPWGSRPDYGRPEVRQYILDNITMWLEEYHVDGFRLDSTIYMRNTAGNGDPATNIPDAWSLLQDITTLAHEINPRAILIAEDDSSTSAIVDPVSIGGCGFDAQWQLNFSRSIRGELNVPTPYAGNFFTELTTSYGNSPFHRIIFSDSHDTAANGYARINTATSETNPTSKLAQQKTIVANAAALTANGTPMLLQGIEFLQGGDFNDWNELEWKKTESLSGIVNAHRHIIDLRHNRYGNTAGLMGASQEILHQNEKDRVVAYHRWDAGGVRDDTVVVLNLGDGAFDSYQLRFPARGTWHARFNSTWKGYSRDFKETTVDTVDIDKDMMATIPLAPYAVYIFSQD